MLRLLSRIWRRWRPKSRAAFPRGVIAIFKTSPNQDQRGLFRLHRALLNPKHREFKRSINLTNAREERTRSGHTIIAKEWTHCALVSCVGDQIVNKPTCDQELAWLEGMPATVHSIVEDREVVAVAIIVGLTCDQLSDNARDQALRRLKRSE